MLITQFKKNLPNIRFKHILFNTAVLFGVMLTTSQKKNQKNKKPHSCLILFCPFLSLLPFVN